MAGLVLARRVWKQGSSLLLLVAAVPASHAAPTITSQSVHDAQVIAEAAGLAPTNEVFALLHELVRPYVSAEALNAFDSRLQRRRLDTEHASHKGASPARALSTTTPEAPDVIRP